MAARKPSALNQSEILQQLALAEAELESRRLQPGSVQTQSARAVPSGSPKTLPRREIESSHAVDAACVKLAASLAKRLQRPKDSHALAAVSPLILDLVVARVRDAQRYVRSFPALPRTWPTAAEAIFGFLLFRGWHEYAEGYFRERVERFGLG